MRTADSLRAFLADLNPDEVAIARKLIRLLPALRMRAPKGTGDVLVLPPDGAGDAQTWLLRRFLGSLGYRVSSWLENKPRFAQKRPVDCEAIADRLLLLIEGSGCVPGLIACGSAAGRALEVAAVRPDLLAGVVLVAPGTRRASSQGAGGACPSQLAQALSGELPLVCIASGGRSVPAPSQHPVAQGRRRWDRVRLLDATGLLAIADVLARCFGRTV